MFDEALDISGLVLTKLDGTAKGGIVIAICSALKIPLQRFLLVCWIGKTIKTILFALGGQAVLFPFLNP